MSSHCGICFYFIYLFDRFATCICRVHLVRCGPRDARMALQGIGQCRCSVFGSFGCVRLNYWTERSCPHGWRGSSSTSWIKCRTLLHREVYCRELICERHKCKPCRARYRRWIVDYEQWARYRRWIVDYEQWKMPFGTFRLLLL
jgi:hypothetical protein